MSENDQEYIDAVNRVRQSVYNLINGFIMVDRKEYERLNRENEALKKAIDLLRISLRSHPLPESYPVNLLQIISNMLDEAEL